MEQNFVNFIDLLPLVDRQCASEAIAALLARFETDRPAFDLLVNTADKYLYDPNSPMLNEEDYLLFLNELVKSDFIASDDKIRFKSQRADVLKNRAGTKATNFPYVDNLGRSATLYTTPADEPLRLLMFYDPDCEQCQQIEDVIKADPTINTLIEAGSLRLMAVYFEDDAEMWNNSKDLLPALWHSLWAPAIDRDELYVVRATPSLYLLSADNTVVLKDAPINTIIAYLQSR